MRYANNCRNYKPIRVIKYKKFCSNCKHNVKGMNCCSEYDTINKEIEVEN